MTQADSFITKDSGQREEFETGSVRDTQADKMRWDLLPYEEIERVVGIYTRGAQKYDDNNWKKGQPVGRYWASMMRHLLDYRLGRNPQEDHAAAAIWNILAMMWTMTNLPEMNKGFLPEPLVAQSLSRSAQMDEDLSGSTLTLDRRPSRGGQVIATFHTSDGLECKPRKVGMHEVLAVFAMTAGYKNFEVVVDED